MEIPRHITALGFVFGSICSAIATAGEPPSPTPTPKPGTLAALATVRSLNRAPGADASATIVITNDNLDELGGGAALTVLTSTVAEAVTLDSGDRVDPKTREKWRSKVLAQSKVIARAEAKRDAVRTEIDRLERGRLDSRTLDRIAKAEVKLREADDEIKRAKAELSKIVREARKEGAQPGWFR
jgi:hypothetical protein